MESRYNEIFGQNLRKYRESLNQSRQIFVSIYGGSPHTLQSYESGNKAPNFRRFIHLSNSLRLSPNVLLDGLFPWKTELDNLQELQEMMQGLHGQFAQKIRGFQEIYLLDAIGGYPNLSGASFGTKIHLLRLNAGFDIDTISKRCMVAKPTMQGYESGQYDPSIPVVLRLCEIFGVSPEYLLAPVLDNLTYSDSRMVNLYPHQIKTFLDLSRYYINSFSSMS